MKDTEGVFDEFAAAFQFPYYFGENWAAFNDCLTDLSWLPAAAYLVCITKADQLLSSEAPASFEVLVEYLQDIARGWGGENPNLALMGRKATPFHILMQVSKDVEQITLDRLASAGATAEVVGWK
jgi:RNAse (barnase) inhibitor barstar